ncbi:hypothetical protein ACN47E_001525 [Coniothyrium glycines]
MLDLCLRLNNAVDSSQITGSFNSKLEDKIKQINSNIWRTNSVIVVLNTEDVAPLKDISRSWYCFATAITTIHNLIQRLMYLSSDSIMILAPYNAQIRVLLTLRKGAIKTANAVNDRKLAKELNEVMIITVDSSIGKDRPYVILDTVGRDRGFLWRQPRTLVAGTRARTGFTFVGPTYPYTSSEHIEPDNRLKQMLFSWGSKKYIVTIPKIKLASFEQYHDVQRTLNAF